MFSNFILNPKFIPRKSMKLSLEEYMSKKEHTLVVENILNDEDVTKTNWLIFRKLQKHNGNIWSACLLRLPRIQEERNSERKNLMTCICFLKISIDENFHFIFKAIYQICIAAYHFYARRYFGLHGFSLTLITRILYFYVAH